MTDLAVGRFTLGLGLVSGVALVTEVEGVVARPAGAARSSSRAGKMPLVSLATGAALLRQDAAREPVGEIDIHGDLAALTLQASGDLDRLS